MKSSAHVLSVRLAVALALGLPCLPPLARADLFADAEPRGKLIAPPEDGEHDLEECSGLIVSRRNAGVLWANDDSFHTAVYVLSFDPQARFLRRYKILNDPRGDFEELTLGKGPKAGVDYLYLGDIGNNAAQKPADFPRKNPPRATLKVHRFPEPANVTPGDDIDLTDQVTTLTLRYPDRPHNAEAMMMDPEGNLYIVIKEPTGEVFGVKRETLAAYAGGIITLERVATITPQFVTTNLHFGGKKKKTPDGKVYGVTGGCISPDGSMILIKNMWEAFLWFTRDAPTKENPWSRWAATLSPRGPTVPESRESLIRVAPIAPDTAEPSGIGRGETIAFSADGNGYFTAAEGRGTPLYYFAAKTPAPDELTATRTPASRVALAWRDRSGNETGFLIERKIEGSGDFAPVSEVGANLTTFESPDAPSPGQLWKYRVRARTAEGYSAFSAEANVAPDPEFGRKN